MTSHDHTGKHALDYWILDNLGVSYLIRFLTHYDSCALNRSHPLYDMYCGHAKLTLRYRKCHDCIFADENKRCFFTKEIEYDRVI